MRERENRQVHTFHVCYSRCYGSIHGVLTFFCCKYGMKRGHRHISLSYIVTTFGFFLTKLCFLRFLTPFPGCWQISQNKCGWSFVSLYKLPSCRTRYSFGELCIFRVYMVCFHLHCMDFLEA